MPRKIIGIVANHNPDEGRFWLNANYVRYFETYGLVKLIDPLNDKPDCEVDLLVLPGGSDISSLRYGVPHLECIGMPNRAYETFDYYVLPQYVRAGFPIFGICRGWQSLNVHFGGGLVPHLWGHPTSHGDGQPVHYVANHDRSFSSLSSSNHHQGVTEELLAPCFDPLLWSYGLEHEWKGQKQVLKMGEKEDVIEAARHKELKISAVQLHPEKNYFAENGKQTCKKLDEYVREMIANLF